MNFYDKQKELTKVAVIISFEIISFEVTVSTEHDYKRLPKLQRLQISNATLRVKNCMDVYFFYVLMWIHSIIAKNLGF